MKKLTIAMLAIALTLSIASCQKKLSGEGPLVTAQRTITGFNEIDLQMSGNVYYRKDNNPRVEILAQQNIIDVLETYVSGNKLIVKFKSGHDYRVSDLIRINVYAPNAYNFVSHTAGSIYVLSNIEAPSIFLRGEGAGEISIQEVNAATLEAYSLGSGAISVGYGSVTSQKLRTIGSGKIEMSGLHSKTTKAETVGSGYIKARVSDYLDARIEGSGSIYYLGLPQLSTHVSGSGRVIRL